MGKEDHLTTVIVACIIVNDQDRLLMIQEAKESCYGKWYIPAGKVLQGESLKQAVIREVLEETGLRFEPSGIFSVEYIPETTNSLLWTRYGITGKTTGGHLKSVKDSSSLCAKWVNMSELKAMLDKGETRGSDLITLYTDFRKGIILPLL
jgi:8-oxo-dGDP phosphatase